MEHTRGTSGLPAAGGRCGASAVRGRCHLREQHACLMMLITISSGRHWLLHWLLHCTSGKTVRHTKALPNARSYLQASH